MNIGQAILEVRIEKGLKQETVALDAETDSGYLSRVENGTRCPSLAMLGRLAAALGTSVSSLIARAESSDGTTASNEPGMCCEVFGSLTSENQHLALELLSTLQRVQRGK